MKFHLWIPNLFGFKGGIQVYSSFFLQALQNLYPHDQHHVFIKHDIQALPNPNIVYLPETRFHFAGRLPLKLRTPIFAAQIIGQGLLQRPDLIITTHLNFTVAAHLLKRLTGIPYWTIAHGIEAWNIQNPELQVALRNADRILAVSNFTRDRLLKEQNLDPKKISLLPNTFNTQRFQITSKPTHLLQRYGLTPEQPIILTVARLSQTEKYKGYDKLLHALPLIRKVIPDIHYILVGKGDDLPRIREVIAELQIQDFVTLTGFIPDEELGDHYNLCDVFAMPSKKEGFGIVYLEALACGKPVLGGNQDGAIDALCHGELGALVNPDEIEVIAQTLMKILQKCYPNPLVYQPEMLRKKVISQFGFASFQNTLCSYLKHYFRTSI
ncbi:glycosyltransferase [Calothrix rhizosoleniae]|uniref:glycosyltransferase n=1 Tax=Calothrix rhizosoleniae TaxID=888997 RepID=UPI000B4A0AED|nr:glycosyltransferase [Calothrix rhizosoleniae]